MSLLHKTIVTMFMTFLSSKGVEFHRNGQRVSPREMLKMKDDFCDELEEMPPGGVR